ncbi:exodeoxyribonuclease V subunit alpha [Ideonella sp. A 288]|uniref:exodeoxyribonuclease V subunit alpha n=1 Tax=Ideonella sp. A 288 TaxID=1962181 RepID=UPI000B4C1B30|nr:exodeoxyribonuclease V subunit alpha [Ideonella sp. A 288]
MTDPKAPSPEQRLANGLARRIERWSQEAGAPADVARKTAEAARRLGLATAEGHVCLSLDDLSAPNDMGDPADDDSGPPADSAAWRRALLASGVVGTPSARGAMPLILDDDDRLYLHRDFDHERRLAQRLIDASNAPPADIDDDTRALLRTLFAANAAGAAAGQTDWQMVAAALALRQRLTVISGGPGTGKTTTVVNLLACLVAQDAQCRIALAAPTGKAAARMTEALRSRAAHLPRHLAERLPTEAFTVHRLLGVRGEGHGFTHHAGHPLAIDALVVDEASMLDLALARRLLDAVPPGARIVLLGDKDQLASVESGAVFSELCADPTLSPACARDIAAWCGLPPGQPAPPPPAQPSALRDSVVWFTRNFRFAADSGIARLAALVNAGRADEALAALRQHGDDAVVRWLDDDGGQAANAPHPATATAALDPLLIAGYAGHLAAVHDTPHDPDAVTRAFNRFRVLCAVREGRRGVIAVNERLTRHARQSLAGTPLAQGLDERSPWFAGRPVMVLRNDPVLRLFNGDIGIALPDPASGELMVHFADGASGFRAIAPVRLPEHQTAFAMTVHKAQGSEFDAVAVLLPERRSRVLTRELLYTAVTRARERVTLCGSADVLQQAIRSATRRDTGLIARLGKAEVAARPDLG